MAWWNNPAGGRTPEVSLERVAAWFDANGFAYELTEDNPGIAASFGRYGYVIEVLDDIMAVHARFWTDLPDDEATTAGVRSLLSQFNRSRVVPTLASFVNDDGHQMAAQIPVFIAQGLNDDQLDDALGTCLEVIEDFAARPPCPACPKLRRQTGPWPLPQHERPLIIRGANSRRQPKTTISPSHS